MTNMFWNKFNNEFRGYGEPTNNYNQNANHQVSNNSNSYNSWSIIGEHKNKIIQVLHGIISMIA